MNLMWNPELFTIRLSAGDGAAARTEKSAHGSGGAASGTAREPQTPGAQAQTGVPPRRPLASTIAGSWYPSDPGKLRAELEKYLASADAESAGRTAGDDCNIFIVPHAGYVYSGPCAAFAYRRMRNRSFRRVLLLAPSHRVWLDDQVVLPESDAVSTPLGVIPLDPALGAAFRSKPFVKNSDPVHRDEHSTQIQYPFLQTVLGDDFTILPVIVGKLSSSTASKLGDLLLSLMTPETLLIVSSDFTHYGSRFGYAPFQSDFQENVRLVDFEAYQYIQNHDPAAFHRFIERNHCTICGSEPIRAVLEMKTPVFETTLFHYCNSASASGDRDFVCYLACGIRVPTVDPAVLSDNDKALLLDFARRAIRKKLETGRSPAPDAYKEETSPAMRKVMGAFVTLHTASGALRGCIGEIAPYRPLYEAVTARACDAAFRDPRFFSLRESEFGSIRLEISALTPPEPIDDWRKIEIGRHGMTVTKNGRSAVFLPQVAPEQGWTLEQTLSQLCLKAGLRPDDFRSGATFTVFEAIVFSE